MDAICWFILSCLNDCTISDMKSCVSDKLGKFSFSYKITQSYQDQ